MVKPRSPLMPSSSIWLSLSISNLNEFLFPLIAILKDELLTDHKIAISLNCNFRKSRSHKITISLAWVTTLTEWWPSHVKSCSIMSKFLTRADWNLNIFHTYWTGRAGAAFVRDQRTNRFELGQDTDIFRSLVIVWSSSTRISVGVSLAFICVEFGDTIAFKSLD